ncbi:MAG: hypothetical protein GY928_23980 [Colwellia sp.]|nr:hypothetical protein [Colwellia sp.]
MTFSDRIFASFSKGWGPATVIVGLLGTYAPIYFDLTIDIKLKYLLAIGVFALMVLVFSLKIAFEAHSESIRKPLKVLAIDNPSSTYKKDYDALLILEPSDLISHDSLVSVYYIAENRNGLELFVGLGKVINVQNDKKIQVLVRKEEKSDKPITDIKSNDLDFVLVKPSVPYQLLL